MRFFTWLKLFAVTSVTSKGKNLLGNILNVLDVRTLLPELNFLPCK